MKFIVWLILGYIGYRIIKGYFSTRDASTSATGKDTEAFQDPVCGVYVSAEDATVGRLEGKKIYFCSLGCLEKYQEKLKQ